MPLNMIKTLIVRLIPAHIHCRYCGATFSSDEECYIHDLETHRGDVLFVSEEFRSRVGDLKSAAEDFRQTEEHESNASGPMQ